MRSAPHVILTVQAKLVFESLNGFGAERYLWEKEGSFISLRNSLWFAFIEAKIKLRIVHSNLLQNLSDYYHLKKQIESEFVDGTNGHLSKSFLDLPKMEQQSRLKDRLKKYCQKVCYICY